MPKLFLFGNTKGPEVLRFVATLTSSGCITLAPSINDTGVLHRALCLTRASVSCATWNLLAELPGMSIILIRFEQAVIPFEFLDAETIDVTGDGMAAVQELHKLVSNVRAR